MVSLLAVVVVLVNIIIIIIIFTSEQCISVLLTNNFTPEPASSEVEFFQYLRILGLRKAKAIDKIKFSRHNYCDV